MSVGEPVQGHCPRTDVQTSPGYHPRRPSKTFSEGGTTTPIRERTLRLAQTEDLVVGDRGTVSTGLISGLAPPERVLGCPSGRSPDPGDGGSPRKRTYGHQGVSPSSLFPEWSKSWSGPDPCPSILRLFRCHYPLLGSQGPDTTLGTSIRGREGN